MTSVLAKRSLESYILTEEGEVYPTGNPIWVSIKYFKKCAALS